MAAAVSVATVTASGGTQAAGGLTVHSRPARSWGSARMS
jgi:hypothetical protein